MPADVTVGGQIGESRTAVGVPGTAIRQGPYAEVIVNDTGYGRFFEATRVGRVFTLSTALAATLNGNASPLAAAGTPVWGIVNPVGNAYAAVILKATCQMIIGATATPISPVWDIGTSLTGLTGTGGGTIRSTLVGTAKGSSMTPFVAAALTGRANASVLLRGWQGSQSEVRHVGTTSETGMNVISEDTDGSIIVLPGTVLTVEFNQAGAAVTGNVAVVWAEVDWPL